MIANCPRPPLNIFFRLVNIYSNTALITTKLYLPGRFDLYQRPSSEEVVQFFFRFLPRRRGDKNLIKDREHGCNLRSTTTALCQPFTTTTFAKRAFRCSAPAVWNSLPKTVLSSNPVAVFKSRLKTFLVSQAFSSFSAH